MVRITEQLIRKKSEHNELIIGTLEELSLHQEDIEQIEHIGRWCRSLKILLLQNNLIQRIENLNKLKRLEYLNLAINNIEWIENLEGLESLQKLDLTLNFIGELTGVEKLQANYNLRELLLTGNPCTDYHGYRNFVINALPQLDNLDGAEITLTHKHMARGEFEDGQQRRRIVQAESEYKIKRDEQKIRVLEQREREEMECANMTADEQNERFWKNTSEHCPETRLAIAQQQQKNKNPNAVDCGAKQKSVKRTITLFAECGRPYNINEPKIDFHMSDEPDAYKLDLHIYKFLDTSLIDVDVQPHYCRVVIKKKTFQMSLADEVKITESTSQRSMTTGHLLITMPKLNYKHSFKPNKQTIEENKKKKNNTSDDHHQFVDYKNIVKTAADLPDNDNDVPPLV